MRHDLIQRIQRVLSLISVALLLILGVLIMQQAGLLRWGVASINLRALLPVVPQGRPQVALISGHAGYDSGAVCDGSSITEADVTARITELVANQLRRRNLSVIVLDEYDERLNGLRADLLLSLHADSCVPLSGYKVAHRVDSPVSEMEANLLSCINEHYPGHTDLAPHPDTITHDMIAYHAFRRVHPQTPAAILEMGFLGGDQDLLLNRPQRVAQGTIDSITCFLDSR